MVLDAPFDLLRQLPDLDKVFQCPFDSVEILDGITGLTLFKEGRFQTQLWLCHPNKEIPDHTHPEVETLLVYISGEVTLRVAGREFHFTKESVQSNPRMRRGAELYVPAGALHGLSVGPLGCAFLSVQKWPWEREVVSTDKNWTGPSLGPKHDARRGVQ